MPLRDSGVQELDNLLEQSRGVRSSLEPAWYQSLAFYQGEQWGFWAQGRLNPPNLSGDRITVTDNRILGIIRTEIAKMTKQRPVWVVTPNSSSDQDMDAAAIGELVVDAKWLELRLNLRLRNALMWARVCTAGFWKVFWDSQQGEKFSVLCDEQNKPITNEHGSPLRPDDERVRATLEALPEEQRNTVRTKEVSQGDAKVEVRSPFEIFPDPLAEEGGIDDCEWLIEESVRSEAYVKDRYGKAVTADAEAVAGISEGRTLGRGGTAGSTNYKGVRVREYWHQPGSAHPKGKRVVWAGQEILAEDICPYPDLPYIMFPGIAVPGRFWPSSMADQLRGPQTDLNKATSQIRENAARFGNPSLLESKYAQVEYDGFPGSRVKYDPSMPDSIPQFLAPPELPGYVQQDIERIEGSLREISGQHEITSGRVPAGVTAASAINLLQEQDDTRLGPDIEDMETALSTAGSKLLWLVANFYTDERTVKLAGEDKEWQIFGFKGAMLKDHTQVEVQAGSAFPRSKAAKQAAMHELLSLIIQYGVDIDPRDLRRFFKDYELGGLERMFQSLGKDEQQINDENRRLAAGEVVELNSFDNDNAHLAGHEEFQKSSRYRRLPPDAQKVVEDHAASHRERFLQAQEAQVQATQEGLEQQPSGQGPPGQGAPPQGGLPSAPNGQPSGSVRQTDNPLAQGPPGLGGQ